MRWVSAKRSIEARALDDFGARYKRILVAERELIAVALEVARRADFGPADVSAISAAAAELNAARADFDGPLPPLPKPRRRP